MKVILVTPNFHQQRGNTITVQRIADKLSELKIRTEVVSITEENNIKTLPHGDIIHGFNAYRFYKFKEELATEINQYVVTITGTDLNHDLFDQNKRSDVVQSVIKAEFVHVFSDEAKQLLIREVPSVSKKVVIIPQDTDEFVVDTSSPFKKEEKTSLFVLPAGIRQVKNIPFAINGLKRLHEEFPFIRLLLVGPILEDKEWQKVKTLIDENQQWVQYIGEVPHQKMGTIYHQADVLLNTSYTEGQSTAIMEGMASELPVLVSNNNGNRSLVSNGLTGFVYENIFDFYDYAKQLILNPNKRRELGKAAKQYITKHHTNSNEAMSLLEIYNHIYNESK
ncbi:glycosyltransferase family 4 protein [Mesobacillus maritimus]|uniref:glycosyltransferase family 4 protein n=1 Tax=Mesobacillus maritimus TaxID=1643336 RepID=UPI00384A8EA9